MRLFAGSTLWIGLALALVAGALVLEPLRRGAVVLPPDDDELEARIRGARGATSSADASSDGGAADAADDAAPATSGDR